MNDNIEQRHQVEMWEDRANLMLLGMMTGGVLAWQTAPILGCFVAGSFATVRFVCHRCGEVAADTFSYESLSHESGSDLFIGVALLGLTAWMGHGPAMSDALFAPVGLGIELLTVASAVAGLGWGERQAIDA